MNFRKGIILAIVAGIACAAWAGDGIPMGNAVFYPSIEAVYATTDNLYLQDSTMPNGNESGHWWQIRPTLGFEFPYKMSYVRLDLGYQYQDYSNSFALRTHDQYTADLKGIFKFGNGHSFSIEDGYIRGLREVTKFDPGYESYYSNTPFDQNSLRLGLDLAINKLNSLGIYGLYNTASFSDVTDIYKTPFFDYHQEGGGLQWKYNYKPDSNFLVDVRYLENRPDAHAWDSTLYTDVNAKKYDSWQALTGVDGKFGTMLTGYAKAGWSNLDFKNAHSSFSGFVGDVGLSVHATQFFDIDLKAQRQAYQSAYNVNNYYTTTAGELALRQQVSRYFFWTAGYRYQENAYPDKSEAYPLGIYGTTTPEFLYSAGETRKDKISRAFAEVGYHMNKQFSLKLNYQYEDRNSSIKYTDPTTGFHRPYTYTENRFALSAQFGW